jgi:inorganic pyrophosphatase
MNGLCHFAAAVLVPCSIAIAAVQPDPGMSAWAAVQPDLRVLPAAAATRLTESLKAAASHPSHAWRDTPPFAGGGLVNAYIEIPLGERRKYEFDMRTNRLIIDRVLPADIGGYPVNYGYVPQTMSYDGDPFDVLVLGPALARGQIVQGAIVGLMFMEDEKGLDAKVVISTVDASGAAKYELADGVRERIGGYFEKYKRGDPKTFSKVPGWGTIAEGRWHVETTHTFFLECRERPGEPCRVGTAQAIVARRGFLSP